MTIESAQNYWELCNGRVIAATDRRDQLLNQLIAAQAELRQWTASAGEAMDELSDELRAVDPSLDFPKIGTALSGLVDAVVGYGRSGPLVEFDGDMFDEDSAL